MLIRVVFISACLLEVVYGCIPTQQVEACQVCQKIYDKSCVGYVAGQSWCATAATVGVTYVNGEDELIHFGDSETCHLYYDCPAGYTSAPDLYGAAVPSDPYYPQVMAYCKETGADAGSWYFGLPDGETPWAPIPLKSLKCVG